MEQKSRGSPRKTAAASMAGWRPQLPGSSEISTHRLHLVSSFRPCRGSSSSSPPSSSSVHRPSRWRTRIGHVLALVRYPSNKQSKGCPHSAPIAPNRDSDSDLTLRLTGERSCIVHTHIVQLWLQVRCRPSVRRTDGRTDERTEATGGSSGQERIGTMCGRCALQKSHFGDTLNRVSRFRHAEYEYPQYPVALYK